MEDKGKELCESDDEKEKKEEEEEDQDEVDMLPHVECFFFKEAIQGGKSGINLPQVPVCCAAVGNSVWSGEETGFVSTW
eukprot:CAMPEP_0201542268 /NCGR_PEP_ID=MMETSP0161_2-20130828/71939_1 /ASSEMBLY_ACC=CAM_ASM_000251 /TAXON_ID=180227 /ORGANISM="Neoparamoeba aestuarina, Strain SoJaBio B1-5/56/2" /LENGTH=78 /DNA_ID=CAMNT_0047949901 /DNA_START=155 /DNA_END=388 /DNA_ORIENTATION=-